MAGEADSLFLLLLALIFPPAAAAFVSGCGADLCLNILLTLIGYFPGCIHAFWLVFRRTEANERYGYKNWMYTGMGEYAPRDAGSGSYSGRHSASYGPAQGPPPPPPPAGVQSPAVKPPPSQALGGTAPTEQVYGGNQAPPQAPTHQKVTPPEPVSDQKPTNPAPQYTATPSST